MEGPTETHQAAAAMNNCALYGVAPLELALDDVDLGDGAVMDMGEGFGQLDI